jgi:hypothetical protein
VSISGCVSYVSRMYPYGSFPLYTVLVYKILSFPPVNMAFLTYITVTETNFNETLTDLYFHKLLVLWVECCIFV